MYFALRCRLGVERAHIFVNEKRACLGQFSYRHLERVIERGWRKRREEVR
jgi:hypothetical protein